MPAQPSADSEGQRQQKSRSAPDSIELRHTLAQQQLHKGRANAAEEIWRQIVSESPFYEPARAALVESLLAQGRYEEARAEASRICQHRALYAVGKVLLARVAELEGRASVEVRRHLEDAVRHVPDSLDALKELCHFFFRHEMWSDVEIALREWLRRDGKDEVAWCNLGTTLLQMERPTEAEEAYHRALEINAGNHVARHNLDFLSEVSGIRSARQNSEEEDHQERDAP